MRKYGPVAVLIVLALAVWVFLNAVDRPLFDASVSRVLYDRDGQLLGAVIAADDQWRFPAPQTVPDRRALSILARCCRMGRGRRGIRRSRGSGEATTP